MKKTKLFCLVILFYFSTINQHAYSEGFGVEFGYAYLPGFEDEVKDTAQSIANLLGSTVTYESDAGALVLRAFYQNPIDKKIDLEFGLFTTTDVETTFSYSGGNATIAQSVTGLDVSLLYKLTSDVQLKGGFHSSEIDGDATVTLGGSSASITSNDSGTSILFGVQSYSENDPLQYSIIYYEGLGGQTDSDAVLFSVQYNF